MEPEEEVMDTRLTVSFRGVIIMEIPLQGSSFGVGSGPGEDLRLAGGSIVNHHLVLRRRGRRWQAVACEGARIMDGEGRSARRMIMRPGVVLRLDQFSLQVENSCPPTETSGTQTLPESRCHDSPPQMELRTPEGCRPRKLRLKDRPVCIGRDASCDLIIEDPYISLKHARISPVAGSWVITDLGSLNGTRIEGKRVDGAELVGGMRIGIGRTIIECGAYGHVVESGSWLVTRGITAVVEEIERCAGTDLPVLILGESGTGKEGIARRLHDRSRRRSGTFVPVNCAAMPESLADSLLFGHAKGAYTGAQEHTQGLISVSSGGTLFLDEVGELSASSQARLLRVIEEGMVRPLGSLQVDPVDLRIVAATNRNLGEMVNRGMFRLDLFHRLAVLTVKIPPLRDRRSDISELARFLISSRVIPAHGLSPSAMELLTRQSWPGNVRELRNVLARGAVEAAGGIIEPGHLRFPASMESGMKPRGELPSTADEAASLLCRASGNISKAARMLGVARSTLRDHLVRLGVPCSVNGLVHGV